jgi:dihydrofolate synthase/folylpolyglutamate synthase
MNYKETLKYLFQQLPMYQRIGGAAFKKDLTNIIALCDHLGQPQHQFKSIHIGGTNGKGSTAHMVAAVLQSAGNRVGLYTSPHYKDFRERIKINGQLVPESFIVDFVNEHRSFLETLKPSFFEITVAIAFDYFARQKVDVAVIEVGLGGRLDSTNIILPVAAAITNISFDHMQFLGNTLAAIAGEKAGIIKPNIPVTIGEEHVETKAVFNEKAKEVQAPIVFASQHYNAQVNKEKDTTTIFDVYHKDQLKFEALELDGQGPYQAANLQTALQLIDTLPVELQVDSDSIRYGLKHLRKLTYYIGRWQFIQESPKILCDSAHNEDGIKQAMKGLLKIPHQHLHIVLGMVTDKEPETLLQYFPATASYYFCKPDVPRGQKPEIIQSAALKYNLKGDVYSSVKEALKSAGNKASADDLIYIGGSIFVVAEVL